MDFNIDGIKRINQNHEILPFDCGDTDLNSFLLEDSKKHCETLLSVTYFIEIDGKTAAFFSLLNDKISAQDSPSNNQWKKHFKNKLHTRKHFNSYPAVKIGRLGIDSSFQNKGFGTALLNYIKIWFITNNKTGCMYITVDAYEKSLKFYLNNDFNFLKTTEEKNDTRLMYYDLSLLK